MIDNKELLLMISLIQMEYDINSIKQLQQLILKEFNRDVSFDQINDLLYGRENLEIESNLIEYYR